LGKLPKLANPDVLVGFDTMDDAGIYRIDPDRALVQTLDFFTPVVDDPFTYGAIAAANALSDVYAMGGQPITALAIACFPDTEIDLDVLAQIMIGGADKLREAQVPLLGGHTVSDPEIKFGYSITGLVHPDRMITNSGAKPGDILLLTKPLGIGILTSGIKFEQTTAEAAEKAIKVMTELNRGASQIMIRFNCRAATDITGNGLLGHGFEMAVESNVSLRIIARQVPFLPEAFALTEAGILPKTAGATWRMIEPHTDVNSSVPGPLRNILLDPQTSGGLLIAVDRKQADAMLRDLIANHIQAAKIGKVESAAEKRLYVE
jgi:selenide,water dikinase